ncbi:hypothetical protein [Streptomyces sp. 8N706]|uniref:hypothetical protein n=1 Tax=Streptomyces sp. 8N706 TaxID=3457416 RepID=UPI003FD5AFD4
MAARVLVICCEPLPELLRDCRRVLAGVNDPDVSSALRTLPGSGPAGAPTLDPHELAAAGGVVFATGGRTPTLASSVAELLAATAPLWSRRQLEDRIVSGFTTADGPAGEEALSGLLRAACHWGSLLLPGPRAGTVTPEALYALGARMGRLAARAPSPVMTGPQR